MMDFYGPPAGSAEINFGRILKEDLFPYRDELIISSKAGYYMWPGPYGEWGSRKSIIASCEQSLKRMGLDYVDIFYSHRPDLISSSRYGNRSSFKIRPKLISAEPAGGP
jgi:L-glyceraldehyde 3-phosphate reductase